MQWGRPQNAQNGAKGTGQSDLNDESRVQNFAIRFGLGSIKNVGKAPVDSIVEEREKHGDYKNFIDFCERIADE